MGIVSIPAAVGSAIINISIDLSVVFVHCIALGTGLTMATGRLIGTLSISYQQSLCKAHTDLNFQKLVLIGRIFGYTRPLYR